MSAYDFSKVNWSDFDDAKAQEVQEASPLAPAQEEGLPTGATVSEDEGWGVLRAATRMGDPAANLSLVELAQKTSLPLATVQQNKDVATDLARQQVLHDMADATPDIARDFIAGRHPLEANALLGDKVINADAAFKGFSKEFFHNLEMGNLAQEQSGLWIKDFMGEITPSERIRLTITGQELEREANRRKDEAFLVGMVRNPVRFATQVFYNQANAFKRSQQFGMTNAALGAFGGAPVAAAGYIAGAGAGWSYGTVEHIYLQSLAETYGAIREMKDDHGNTVDPKVARLIAAVAALPQAGLEFASFKKLLKVIPGGEKLLGAGAVEATKEFIRSNPTLIAAWGSAAKKAAVAIVTEVATENAQEAIQIGAEGFAKDTGHMDMPPLTKEEGIDRLKGVTLGTIKAVTLPFLGVGAARGALSHYRLNRQQKTAKANTDALQQLHTAAAESNTLKTVPELGQDFVRHLAEDSGVTEVFIAPEALQRVLFQSDEGIAVAEKLGVTPDALAENLTLGTDIAIPMEKAMRHIFGQPAGEALMQEMRLAPEVWNSQEAQEYSSAPQDIGSHVKDFLSFLEDVEGEVARSEETRTRREAITAPLLQQMLNSGYTETQARAHADVLAAHAERMAPMFGQDAAAWLQQRLSGIREVTPGTVGLTESDMQRQGVNALKRAPLAERNPVLAHVMGRLDATSLREYPGAYEELRKRHGRKLFKSKAKVGVALDLLADELVSGGLLPEGSGAHELLAELTRGNGDKVQYQSEQSTPKNARGFFSPDTRVIGLFKGKKNLSTLLHEFGHLFLENLREAASLRDAPEQVKQDWENVRKKLGIEGDEISDEAHESFAKLFEAYTREGKAPSVHLEGAFRSFANWLTHIYRSAKRLLGNDDLDPEVREVFDRLLATDEEIDAARQEGSSRSILEESVLEVAPESKERYQSAMVLAHEKAARIISARRLAEETAKRREIAADARDAVKSDSFYTTLDSLRHQGGINWQSMLETLDEPLAWELRKKWQEPFAKGLIKEGGSLDFADAAHLTGHETPLNFAAELLGKPTRKEAVSAHVEAAIKVWNETFAASDEYSAQMDEVLHAELEALTGQGQVSPARLRYEMDKRLGVKKPREVQAEYRALKESLRKQNAVLREVMRDVRAADKEKASEARERLVQTRQEERVKRAALAAAYRARLERSRMEEAILREVKSKSVHDGFRQQILALVSSIKGLAPDSMRPRDYDGLPSLMEFSQNFDSLFGEGEVLFADWIYGLARRPGTMSKGDLSMDAMRELADAVKILAYKGRQHDRMLSFGEKARLTELAGEGIASMDRLTGVAHLTEQGRDSIGGKVASSLRGILSANTAMRFVVDILDGYVNTRGAKRETGANHKILVAPTQEAMGREHQLLREYQTKLVEVLTPLHAGKDITKAFVIGGVPLSEAVSKDWGGMFTMEKVLTVALNMGNDGNRKALMKGYGWSEDHLSMITARLTADDWQGIKNVGDMLNSLYPHINETYMKLNGVPLRKVEAVPFTVTTADGQTMNLPGWYYPLQFDQRFSEKAAENQNKDEQINRSANVMRPASAKSGMTKERTGGALPPRLSLGVLNMHLVDSIHYATHAPALRDISRIINLPEYRSAFTRALGEEAYSELLPWLRHIARPEGEKGNKLEKFVEGLARRGTMYALGLSFKTALMQLMSAPNSMKEIGTTAFFKGMYRMTVSPVAMSREIQGKSAYMQGRSKRLDADVARVLDGFAPGGDLNVKIGNKVFDKAKFDAACFAFIQMMDSAVSKPTWMGAYEQAITRGMAEDAAVRFADEAVIRSQGSGGTMDLTAMMRKGGFYRPFTMFMSFAAADFSRRRYYMGGFAEHLRGGHSAIGFQEFATHFALEWVLPPLLSCMAVSLARDGELPEPEDFAWEFVGNATQGLVFFRDIVRFAQGTFERGETKFGGSAAYRGFEIVGRGLKQAHKAFANDDDEAADKAWRSFIEGFGFFSGVPTMPAWRAIDGYEAYYVNGEGSPLSPLFGKPKKK